LKKDGLLIVSTPLLKDNKYHSGNIYHLCEYKEEELYEVLDLHKLIIKEKIFFDTPDKNKMIIVVTENKEATN